MRLELSVKRRADGFEVSVIRHGPTLTGEYVPSRVVASALQIQDAARELLNVHRAQGDPIVFEGLLFHDVPSCVVAVAILMRTL